VQSAAKDLIVYPRYGKKALDENLVENTWIGLLQDENEPPDPLDR
jgi:hypothetical protein